MMLSGNLLGILCALTSALSWGSGDFSGGLATRRASQYHVLAVSALSGIAALGILALAWRETLPSPLSALWAGLAGLGGALGIVALYRGLATGNAASVAPTSAVIAAALPVLYAAVTVGLPATAKLAGFAVALVGLWLVAQSAGAGGVGRSGLGLGALAGVGFGTFFILIAQAAPQSVFTPLIIARSAMLGTALLLMLARRLPLPSLTANPIALATGVLDAGGNIFYILARQFTRLDVAVVLASLYPAATVVLARVVLKERITRQQWLGAALCLVAVALIAA
jgi:drug/metabolite transporter (DMT)-like permease